MAVLGGAARPAVSHNVVLPTHPHDESLLLAYD